MASLTKKTLPTDTKQSDQTARSPGDDDARLDTKKSEKSRNADAEILDKWEGHNAEERLHPERHADSRGPHRPPVDD
jgi:hypothetical protein